jgi:hypothetical protein
MNKCINDAFLGAPSAMKNADDAPETGDLRQKSTFRED